MPNLKIKNETKNRFYVAPYGTSVQVDVPPDSEVDVLLDSRSGDPARLTITEQSVMVTGIPRTRE